MLKLSQRKVDTSRGPTKVWYIKGVCPFTGDKFYRSTRCHLKGDAEVVLARVLREQKEKAQHGDKGTRNFGDAVIQYLHHGGEARFLTPPGIPASYRWHSARPAPCTAANKTQETSDISFHSQNLSYCFNFDWGFDTILIAGTFEKPEKGNFQNFMEYDWVANLNNRGKKLKGLLGRLLDRVMK